MNLLPHSRILELHSAVISAGLADSRWALFATLDQDFVAMLPTMGNPSAQIMSDLGVMNGVEFLSNGTVPLMIWLANAVRLAGLQQQAAIFNEARSACPAVRGPLPFIATADGLSSDSCLSPGKPPDQPSKTIAQRLLELLEEVKGTSSGYARRRPSPGGAPPSTLPNYTGLPFIGRARELEAIESAFADVARPGLLVLHGEPGVGKTRLAVEYAERHLHRYPGGVSFVEFADPPLDLVKKVLRQRGLRDDYKESPMEQCERALHNLGEKPTLLIYDGVTSEQDLKKWLPSGGSRCHVLATSTSRAWTTRYAPCPVPPLPEEDARPLATKLLGDSEVAMGYVDGLVRHAGGVASQLCANAIAVQDAIARGVSVDIEMLAEETRRSFGVVWMLLSDDARLLLRVAALFEGSSIHAEQVRDLLEGEGWNEKRFNKALAMVTDRCLLTACGDALRAHDLFRRFAFQQSEPELGAGLVSRYVRGAEEAARAANANPTDVALASRLLSYPGADSWERFADVLREKAGDVAHAHGNALLSSGKWDAARDWYDRAAKAKRKGDARGRADHRSLGISLHQEGYCLVHLGRFEEARDCFDRAVASHGKGDIQGRVDHYELGKGLFWVGKCSWETNRLDEARGWFERAVRAHEKGDVQGRVDHNELGISLCWIGVCLRHASRFNEALDWFERAVAAQKKGNVQGRVDYNELGISLHEVGACLSDMGRFDEARDRFERAVAAKEKGDVQGRIDHTQLGRSLDLIGGRLWLTGRFDEARDWFERAVAAKEKGDVHGRIDHTGLGRSLDCIGECLRLPSRFGEARDWFERAVAAKEKGDVHGRIDHTQLGISLHQTGYCLQNMGCFDEACDWFDRAVVAKEKGDVQERINHTELGISLHQAGYCLQRMNRFDEARDSFERAVAAKEKGDIQGRIDHKELALSLYHMGCYWLRMGRLDEARAWLERAVVAQKKGNALGHVDQASLADTMHMLETIAQLEHLCPCGSGATFHECHGTPDEQET